MKKRKPAVKWRPPGPHFSSDELLAIRSATEPLAWEVEVRLIHHLALPCRKCWAAVHALPPLADGEPPPRVLVVRALCRLGMPEEVLGELTEGHRQALVQACDWPLAFCELLLEEAWWAVRASPEMPAEQLYHAFGPIAGNGVCLLAPREAHDLQARFFAFLGTAYCDAGAVGPAENAAALAKAHLARGTCKKGGPNPRSGS